MFKPQAALLLFATAVIANAQGTRQWTVTRYEEFERGTPTNVAVRNDGRLEPAPALRTVAATQSNFLWSLAATSTDLYAGTGAASGGSQLLKIDSKGTVTTTASFKELGVQAVLPLADGSVLAATSPDGKVYRIAPDSATPQVVFEEKTKYLWAMALAKDGDLLLAAGAPSTIYKISLKTPSPQPKVFFKSGDQHIRSLVVAPDGTVYAGSDGAGLIYRITPDGKPFALYAAPKHEITALALDDHGNLFAAAVGDRRPPSLPPLPASGQLGATITILQPGSALSASNNSIVPEGSEIYRISVDGTPLRLIALKQDVIYALAIRNGALYAGSGNRGHVYRMDAPIDTALPGSYTDIAHTEASQVTAIAQTASGLALATANSGKVLQLSDIPSANATYLSDVFDGEITTRWGRVETHGSTAGVDLFVRSGNVENAHDSLAHLWSDWAPVKPNQTPLAVPAARYVQWKAALHPGAQLQSVTVNYLQRNLPPQIDDLVVQPGARAANNTGGTASTLVPISFRTTPSAAPSLSPGETGAPPLMAQKDRNAVTARWLAHDPNNDDLQYAVDYRGTGEQAWHRLKDHITGSSYSFDASLLPDGDYELRVTATDAAVHTPGDALENTRTSDVFTVDTTPPVPGTLTATVSNGKLHATFEATDATSPISKAELSLDAGPWQYLEPTGGLSDSRTEHYDITLPVTGTGEHTVAIRVFDRLENAVSVKAVSK